MPAWKPEQLGERTWLLPTGVNVGLWEAKDGAVLIDSGGDKEAGRQIRQTLEERGWTLRLIVNTHSNADHVGGNAYLQKQTGCRVAATRLEAAFIADPVLEPSFLWGAAPFRELRGKFLQAAPSTVDLPLPDSGSIPGTDLEAVALPGHFLQMIGVLTPDGVLFAGDSLFGEEVLAKHPVFFLYDVAAHLETLQRLEGMSAQWIVPGHGRPVREAGPLVAANRAALQRTAETVIAFCSRPVGFEEILAELCRVFALELNASQYVLVGGTLRAYLAWLSDRGVLRPSFEKGRMLWSPGPQTT
jgi:glyoxylase-like metal-dependent hydrolase (beta-lactamase superfamily II)